MVVETLRIVAAALADPSYGVAAQLTAMGAESIIASGETPPPLGVIENAADHAPRLRTHDFVAPALLVEYEESVVDFGDGASQQVRDQTITITATYVAKDAYTPAVIAAASYTVRAALRSMNHLEAVAAPSDREMHGIQLLHFTGTDLSFPELDDELPPQAVGVIRLEALVRDIAP